MISEKYTYKIKHKEEFLPHKFTEISEAEEFFRELKNMNYNKISLCEINIETNTTKVINEY